MKKIFLLFILFVATHTFAQGNGISYQAVILNPKGEKLPGVNNLNSPLVNKNICMVFKFVDEFSNVEYQEAIQTKTDGFGMVNLVIGSGNQTAGYAASFKDIVWNVSKKSLIVGLNTEGNCTTYTEISNQDFSYVPLAFSAISAENVTGVVAIENGGTNASTLAGARTNLQINNVDNTSDLNKPISVATQSGLNLKENTVNKSTDIEVDHNSDVKYPSVKSVKMYVDGKLLVLSNAITTEVSRATAAENTIADNLVTETNARTTAAATLTSNLTSEINRAIAAENTIADNLVTETNARTTADATLTSNLTSEVSRATTADATLTSNLASEVNRATAAENTIANNLATETNARTTADATLTSNLVSEVSRATTAENTIADNLVTETNARTTADATLTSNLASEVSRATTAENTIANNLATETTARTTADATLTSNLASEVFRATTAENTIANNLATETTARTTADATLTSNLVSEVSRATTAENIIADNLVTETTIRTTADATLTSNLASEVSRAATAENTIADNLATETTARTAADATFQTALDLKATINSPTFTGIVSGIDKTMVGLSNVDNISDLNKPISTATQDALDLKVDKVIGERLINSAEITKLSNLSGINNGDQDLSGYALKTYVDTANATNANLTGDITSIGNATTIGNGKVVTTMILDSNVTDDKIATVSGSKISGDIAGSAANVTGIVSVSNGGTGSSTQNFVDLTTPQTIAGNKTFSNTVTGSSFVKSGGTSIQYLMADGSVSTGGSGTSVTEEADEFTATAAQTSFTLTQTPSSNSKVKMYVNGIRISNTAYSWTGNTLTYIPANNGTYSLSTGDRIQFDYFY